MWQEFKAFLTKSNALALAVGVIIGAASGKVVSALVADLIMPIVGLVLPAGDWRSAKIDLGATGKAILYGDLLGNIVDFAFITLVAFMITKALLKPAPETPVKICPYCKTANDEAATRCKACTSEMTAVAV